ncbi:hypothetical protein BDK51DRAFT_15503 [Blyttiomyces helicus]|uniref:HCP-like protein n=1 Tax=Blyttiomyces helicus TaxID=388810 RepID=A0A4V1IRL8_9FUNG|nr:hypothetical protein BDK51DRAFT_15503 [Blyttiomyces helicus]|eukprot:RKO90507.1 hypothetical protein BDK51DRAFT_15503 [Blyttiomyces helicus]
MEEGFAILKKLANSGNADATYTLGQAYFDDKKYDLAYPQFLLAAKRSHAGACHMVATCAELGRGTKKNHRLSVEFFTKAAKAGHKPAIYRMAIVELRGELGVKRDLKSAVNWLRRGAAVADRDSPQCLLQLALIYESGVPPQIQPDENYAKGLLVEAANLDHAPAQYKLGLAYEHGKFGLPVDPRESIVWYIKSAQSGEAAAQFALAGWYLTGCEGALNQSNGEAIFWANKAANQNLPKAQYAMGEF